MPHHPLSLLLSRVVIVGMLGFWLSSAGGVASAEPTDSKPKAGPPKRVLLVTGEDYKGHKWKQTTPVLREQLQQDGRLAVKVIEDLKELRSLRLDDYDVVVMHFKNYDPEVPGRAGFDNLAGFVKSGGGLVLVHFACGAFQEFGADFEELAGQIWNPKLRGHDPHGTFRVEIVDQQHPVTRGLKPFETTDELYTCLDGDTPITILADAQSKVDGKRYPIAFVLTCGKGRVFHCVLGHDVIALRAATVGELFRRGCVWSAGGDRESSTVPSDPQNREK